MTGLSAFAVWPPRSRAATDSSDVTFRVFTRKCVAIMMKNTEISGLPGKPFDSSSLRTQELRKPWGSSQGKPIPRAVPLARPPFGAKRGKVLR